MWTDARLTADVGRADALAATAALWRGFSDVKRTPATGKSISATYVEIAHFTGTKRDRSWLFYNGIVVASQLGLL